MLFVDVLELTGKRVLVGGDMRPSTPEFMQAFTEGAFVVAGFPSYSSSLAALECTLNQQIEALVCSVPGFLGMKFWQDCNWSPETSMSFIQLSNIDQMCGDGPANLTITW